MRSGYGKCCEYGSVVSNCSISVQPPSALYGIRRDSSFCFSKNATVSDIQYSASHDEIIFLLTWHVLPLRAQNTSFSVQLVYEGK